MNPELCWLAAPISALLWQIGGTWNKSIRRFGVPLLLSATYLVFKGFSWWLLAYLPLMLIVIRIPFTLIGDSVDENWINWPWIWVAGFLLGAPAAVFGLEGLLYALVPMLVQGSLGTLSNLAFGREAVQWKMVEAMVGLTAAYPICMMITKL